MLISLGILSMGEWQGRLAALAESLAIFINDDGGVLFERTPPSGTAHVNVWASIFAYQAYTLWKSLVQKNNLDTNLLLLLA